MSRTRSCAPRARALLLALVLLIGGCGGTVQDETLAYQGLEVHVQQIDWNTRLGRQSSGDEHAYLSLFLVGVNNGEKRRSFNPLDFRLIDGSGQTYGAALVAGKEPRFLVCSASPGDECTGWWTARLPNDFQAAQELHLQWQPNWPGSPRFDAIVPGHGAAYRPAVPTPSGGQETLPLSKATPTRTPTRLASGGECGLAVGERVQVQQNARLWSKPTVVGSTASALLPPGEKVYLISGPEWGRIRSDQDSSGWWWQVSRSKSGPALGWIWEGRIAGCN